MNEGWSKSVHWCNFRATFGSFPPFLHRHMFTRLPWKRNEAMHRFFFWIAMVSLALTPASAQISPVQNPLPGGAQWLADVPQKWNGTLLLWSRGYSSNVGKPENAPPNAKAELLAAGYALAGSDYGIGGWALEQAVPAQLATLSAFTARYGKPKRIIAMGNSMGGLVTTALTESPHAQVDGGIAYCASIGGAVGMMNMALDGAFTFRTLVAPDAGIELVNIRDDRANAMRVGEALNAALKSPEGRARATLSGVLGGIPSWTNRSKAEPATGDFEGQAAEITSSITMGLFLPRNDQEARAGGAFSWNYGIDYREQLRLSGRRPLVEALYKNAGLNLDADLARLNAASRIVALPTAVMYLMRHYTPNARPTVPLLAVQAKGDGLTSPSLQRGYGDAAKGKNFRGLWLDQAGHCGFSAPQMIAAIHHIEARLVSGQWPPKPEGFVTHSPAPMLRPCIAGKKCR
jgi:pimeloyl-ACP methyl ester carboxylesterase